MKKIKILLTLIISFFVIADVSAAPSVTVGNATNNKYTISRSITKAKATVSNTFTYTISADSDNPSGGASNVPTSATVAFNNVKPTSGSSVVTATGTIDLSGASFSKNGDYKYVVRETGSTDANNYPIDSTNYYTIQISVRNTSDTDFSGKVVTITCLDKNNAKLDNTTLPFTNDSNYTYISITNTLEGNMADVDEYFKVKVTINGTPGDTYTISGQTKPGASTTYTVGQDNYIYLKHGETVTIGKDNNTSELPKNITYSFEEMEGDNYDTYINNSTTEGKTSPSLTTTTTNNNNIRNVYEEATITGVIIKFIPYILIVAVALSAVVYLKIRNTKKLSE